MLLEDGEGAGCSFPAPVPRPEYVSSLNASVIHPPPGTSICLPIRTPNGPPVIACSRIPGGSAGQAGIVFSAGPGIAVRKFQTDIWRKYSCNEIPARDKFRKVLAALGREAVRFIRSPLPVC